MGSRARSVTNKWVTSSKASWPDQRKHSHLTIPIVLAAVAAVAAVAIAMLLVNIFERQQEARNPFYRVVELNDEIDDPEIWGEEFPAAVRRVQADRRPAAYAIWRQRGRAADADAGRPAV